MGKRFITSKYCRMWDVTDKEKVYMPLLAIISISNPYRYGYIFTVKEIIEDRIENSNIFSIELSGRTWAIQKGICGDPRIYNKDNEIARFKIDSIYDRDLEQIMALSPDDIGIVYANAIFSVENFTDDDFKNFTKELWKELPE